MKLYAHTIIWYNIINVIAFTQFVQLFYHRKLSNLCKFKSKLTKFTQDSYVNVAKRFNIFQVLQVSCIDYSYDLLIADPVADEVRRFRKNISALERVIILGDLDLSNGGYRCLRLKRLVCSWMGGEVIVQRHGLKLLLLSFMTIQNYSAHTENRPCDSINYPS